MSDDHQRLESISEVIGLQINVSNNVPIIQDQDDGQILSIINHHHRSCHHVAVYITLTKFNVIRKVLILMSPFPAGYILSFLPKSAFKVGEREVWQKNDFLRDFFGTFPWAMIAHFGNRLCHCREIYITFIFSIAPNNQYRGDTSRTRNCFLFHDGSGSWKLWVEPKQFQTLKKMTKTGRDKRAKKCNQCQYSSSQSRTLRRHLKTHSGEKSNKCNQCNYATVQAANLTRHMKKHCGEKSYKCYQCDYASSDSGNLKKHLKIHSGERSNKCNQCDFASVSASNLRRHLKTLYFLRTHLKTHSGEKSYKCIQCDYACSDPSSFRKHAKRHRRERLNKCNTNETKHSLSFDEKEQSRSI